MAHQYGDIFGARNFFLEVQDHHLEQDKRLTPELVASPAKPVFRWWPPTIRITCARRMRAPTKS